MTLVKNKTEFVALWPFLLGKPSIFPKKYPCLVEYKPQDDGSWGYSYRLYVADIPKNVCLRSFLLGVNIENRKKYLGNVA